MPFLERTVEFIPGATPNVGGLFPGLDAPLWSIGFAALGAARVETPSYHDPVADSISMQEYFDTPRGAGEATLDLLTHIMPLMRLGGTTADSLYIGLRDGKRSTVIFRETNPESEGLRVAELLGPARREQSVRGVAIRYDQVRGEYSGSWRDARAVYLSAHLTNTERVEGDDAVALVTTIAHSGEAPQQQPDIRSLSVTVGHMHEGGLLLPADGEPSFEVVNRWALALGLLTEGAR